MKDLDAVLRQKDEDLARVRREIQALLIAVPLLEDEHSKWEELKASLANQLRADPPNEDSLRQMEVYYPFIKNLRQDSGTGH